MSDARPEPPPRQRKSPALAAPGPFNSKSVTNVVFTPSPPLLTMATRLVDDGTTPVRAKIIAARVADRLQRQLPVTDEDAGFLRQLYRRRRDELLAAAIVRQRDLLAVHPDYFLLTGGVERWLYRLARKSVPEKAEPPEFRFRLETLFEISGLTGRLRDFRGKIERIADEAPLPEYSVRIERGGRDEMVTLCRDPAKPGRAARPAVYAPQAPTQLPEPAANAPLDHRELTSIQQLIDLCVAQNPITISFPNGKILSVKMDPAIVNRIREGKLDPTDPPEE